MSVTDISQRFERKKKKKKKRKKPPLPLKPLSTVPFLYRHLPPPPPHSFTGLILSIQPYKNAVLNWF